MALPVSFNGTILQNTASDLSEIEQRLKEVVCGERNEWVAICRIDTKEELPEMIDRISTIFSKTLSESVELQTARELWNVFIKEWEKDKILTENLDIILELIPPPENRIVYHQPREEENEEKIDTRGIFEEFRVAIRNKNLSVIPELLMRSETRSLSQNEVVSLLTGAFDAPECFPKLVVYIQQLKNPEILLELLNYGIEHKKWDGVLFLTNAPAFYFLKTETLIGLNERLPSDVLNDSCKIDELRKIISFAIQAKFLD